ncbi:HNH endonuclease signature motif containing protein [Corynebacterium liangguodongii]|nr:HNH endonuclease signature motif containing protein [Corynebacterium liangguodongii]
MEKDQVKRYFRTQRPGDARAELAQRKRDIDFELYSPWADPTYIVDDFELEVTGIQEATGESKATVEKAIFAYRRLADLPWLRAIQESTRLLDVKRLVAIDNVVAELGPELSAEVLGTIDEYLAAMFTPKKADQPLVAPRALTRRLHRFIAKLDERVGFNQRKRDERDKPAGKFTLYEFSGAKRSGLTVECDNATSALMAEYRRQVAREHKLTEAEAAQLILTGGVHGQPRVTIFGYAPVTPSGEVVPGASVFFPGHGWTDAAGTAALDELTEGNPPRVVNLDAVAAHAIDGYVPSANMRAYAVARDGVCLWPGCQRPAEKCQLDHRVPYDEGGATTPSNLYSLCATHHNLKTDRRAYYVPDPVTGDVVWLFGDGTYALAEPEGFIGEQLNQRNPRWNINLDARRRERDRVTTFYARGHKILDEFDATGNRAACESALDALEAEFKMRFPFEIPPEMYYEHPWNPEEGGEPLADYEARIARLIASDPFGR